MFRFSDIPGASFLWWFDLVATTLSFFGCLWMIIHCLKAPSPKSLSLKLIAAIGCADFLYSVSTALSNFQPKDVWDDHFDYFEMDLCSLEAYLRQFSYVLSIWFSTCVSIAAYFSACPRRRFNKTLFFYLSIIIGLLISYMYSSKMIRLFMGHCWITQGPLYCFFSYSTWDDKYETQANDDKFLVAMVFHGLPVIVGLIISSIAYILAIKKLQQISQGLLDESKVTIYRVLWYPGVLFLTFVPNFGMIIYNIYNESPLWMTALHLYLPHSIGFNNALLYGIQTKLYRTNYQEEDRKPREIEDENNSGFEYQSSTKDRRSSVKRSLNEAIAC